MNYAKISSQFFFDQGIMQKFSLYYKDSLTYYIRASLNFFSSSYLSSEENKISSMLTLIDYFPVFVLRCKDYSYNENFYFAQSDMRLEYKNFD